MGLVFSVPRIRRLSSIFLVLSASSFLYAAAPAPQIDAQKSFYKWGAAKLVIRGANFSRDMDVALQSGSNRVDFDGIHFSSSKKLIVTGIQEREIRSSKGLNVKVTDLGTGLAASVQLDVSDDQLLVKADVERIIAQAVVQAQASGFRATVAVTDKEGNVLGVFKMDGSPDQTSIPGGLGGDPKLVEVPADFGAISKAGTGAFLSSQGHAFTTRTASFIVQEHFPPGISFVSGGPLFGVQFSQLLCSDVKTPGLPLGLSADAGGVPLYKSGRLVGGVGVEGDAVYGFDPDPRDNDQPVEELVAIAATRGFDAPSEIRGSEIIVNGIRFPFVNVAAPPSLTLPDFDDLPGRVCAPFDCKSSGSIIDTPPSSFRVVTIDGVQGRIDDRFFPFIDSPSTNANRLTAADVQRILVQGAKQAGITRAAIRRPLNSAAEVNLTVVDLEGNILGIFSTLDAPIFGFDVSAQKARTVAFFSNAAAGARLRAAEKGRFAHYADAAANDGLRLDGSVAFSDRAVGFLSRPFLPDGIDGTQQGPFSQPIGTFSPFNDGLQVDLITTFVKNALKGRLQRCTDIPGLANGIQIFAGSVPLYKNGVLVGAIGVSGDGIDQDDLISTMASTGFEAPPNIRSDRVFVRGVRLPYVKFPRHPNL